VSWKLSSDERTDLLSQQNPWRLTGAVPTELARPTRRPLAGCLGHAMLRDDAVRFQVILGARRVGKTTAMYQTVADLLARGTPARQILWLRLDHPLLMDISVGELVRPACAGGTAARPLLVFLDELTYARDWERWLKTFYDERWPVRVVATSSSSAALRQRRVESGVGRWEEQTMPPWLFGEYLALRGRPLGAVAQPTLAATLAGSATLEHDPIALAEARRREWSRS
jgi:uncharacterized protein